jgi:hypothetical protein
LSNKTGVRTPQVTKKVPVRKRAMEAEEEAMAIHLILKQIDLDTLTDPQKKAIRKILSDRKREFESELKLVDRALGKKRKKKRPAKR